MNHPASRIRASKAAFETRLIALFAGGDGFGLILLYWAFLSLFFCTLTLLAAGWLLWNGWVFFAGLISLRLLIYLSHLAADQLNKITPFDG